MGVPAAGELACRVVLTTLQAQAETAEKIDCTSNSPQSLSSRSFLVGAASNTYQNPQVDQYADDIAPESGLSSNPAVLTVSLGNLANGASATVTITVQVNPSEVGTLSDTVTATGNQPLPSPAHNTAIVTSTVNYSVDLAVTLTVSTASVLVASNVVFTVTVTNNGPSAASGITVSDPLPAGLDFVNYAGSQGSTYDSGIVIWTVGSLIPGATLLGFNVPNVVWYA